MGKFLRIVITSAALAAVGFPWTVLAASPSAEVPAPPSSVPADVAVNPPAAVHAVSAHTLSGRSIVLPSPGRLTLIVGPSYWPQAKSLCARHAILDCYATAAPERGFRRLKSLDAAQKQSVPPAEWDRYAVLPTPADAWKRVAAQAAVLLAPDGEILWEAGAQASGPLPDSLEQTLLSSNY